MKKESREIIIDLLRKRFVEYRKNPTKAKRDNLYDIIDIYFLFDDVTFTEYSKLLDRVRDIYENTRISNREGKVK